MYLDVFVYDNIQKIIIVEKNDVFVYQVFPNTLDFTRSP